MKAIDEKFSSSSKPIVERHAVQQFGKVSGCHMQISAATILNHSNH